MAEKLGDLAGLAGGFEKLGLDAASLCNFTAALIDFIKSQGATSWLRRCSRC